jgi:hypothetical protein
VVIRGVVIRGKERAMRAMFMSALILTAASLAAPSAAAADEALVVDVGPPIAGGGQPNKKSVFVVRPGGCADPAAARFTAAADGVVGGTRRTLRLEPAPLAAPGVHAIQQTWPAEGVWVISVAATCGGRSAGAIVSLASAPPMFRREGVTLLPRAPRLTISKGRC